MATRAQRGLARFSGQLARGAGQAASRFPLAALMIVLIALLSNLAIEDVYVPDEANLAWLLAALYGASASSIVAVVGLEARRAGAMLRLAASAIVAGAVGLATYFGRDFGIFAPPLVVAATFAVPLAPYVLRRDQLRFWTFTLWTVVGAALAFLSVLLFVLGLSAILEMIRFLFEVGLSSRAYEHIFVTAFTLVGPLFALGRIPAEFDETVATDGSDRLVAGLRILLVWIAAPLALATAVVLHLYAAKIALTGHLPKNEIGWIGTFYAFLVLSLRISGEPFLRDRGPAIRLFSRVWAGILVLPLLLLALAIGARLGSEGVTLARYFVALAAIAAALVLAAQLLPRGRSDVRVMAGVPVLLLALSSFGPWGAAATVGRSQSARLIAEYATRVPGSEMIRLRNTKRSDAAHAQIRSRLAALDDAGELDRILPYLEPELATRVAMAEERRPDDAMDVLVGGLGLVHVATASTARGFTALRQPVVDIAGFDRATMEQVVIASTLQTDASAMETEAGQVALRFSDEELVAAIGGVEDRFPIVEGVGGLSETIFSGDPASTSAPVLDLTSPSGRHVRLAIRQLVQQAPGGAILSATLSFYFRSAEWSPAGPPADADRATTRPSAGKTVTRPLERSSAD
ncbi:DUF4153 domain-containing protein [Aurantimonas sp. VKM B-3413]|uniref:DUF4153 domain-containing protein n=1 Tax=Aurantimonas sp. VKM B-3413 TaxID=2779401 RepID=UPI001E626AF5|nr:DUF4153 domain-containing protein [Aurantimonas sp. VKM B-3413]MCB8836687.1 DUF4153 domain-containing protein [Aurantimonas sp. VKM B-3413]